MKNQSLLQLYAGHQGKVSDKWSLYLKEYDRLFKPYKSKPINLLEIGIQNGGSLEIWAKYFHKAEKLIGCDINKDCSKLTFDDPRISVVVGDANTDKVQNKMVEHSPRYNIIIDDGSHTSSDIVKTFLRYFPLLNEGGLFLAEDLHCSYWQQYEGGLFDPYSSISFFKLLADVINHEHWGIDKQQNDLFNGFVEKYQLEKLGEVLTQVHSITFINSICVIRKSPTQSNRLQQRFVTGIDEPVIEGMYKLHGTLPLVQVQSNNPWSTRQLPPYEELPIKLKELDEKSEQVALLSNELSELKQIETSLTMKVKELEKEQKQSYEEAQLKLKKSLSSLNKVSSQLETIKSENNNLSSQFKQAETLFSENILNKEKLKTLKNIAPRFTLGCLFSQPKRQLLKDKQQLLESGLFSPLYYLTNNPDVAQTGINPLNHFLRSGWKEGRNPCKDFDCDFYLAEYPDVAKANINPLIHYLKNGEKEGRKTTGVAHIYCYKEPTLTDKIIQEISSFKSPPLISIIVPVYNIEPKWLDKAIKSVENQWYTNWQLCLVDDASTSLETLEYLKGINNNKIKIKFLKNNGNISKASNEALAMAEGDYIALMDHDDEITPDALYEVVTTINETDAEFIYSDEDSPEIDGTFSNTSHHFKPDYSPDYFLSLNYICHFTVIRKTLIDTVNGFSEGVDGAQDYDLFLKVLEHTDKIFHISKVLYHWRKIPGSTAITMGEKSYADEAGRLALERAMQRRKINALVERGCSPGTYRIKYPINNNPLVSIIIPFKDMPELLTMCIHSIIEKSTYQNFEIIGISNNSENEATFNEMERLKQLDSRIQFYEYNVPFNYSDINNYAVKEYAKGEHILLLNNDIEIITPEWIEELLMFSQRKDVGAVGAKLYYPDDTIQHAGVIIGLRGTASHSHKHFTKEQQGYNQRVNTVQNLSAVTAACLMVKKKVFQENGGLNEKDLKVAFNDVDFCLRLRELGYLNIYTPYCEAYHHESISRGYEDTTEKKKRFRKEVLYIHRRHSNILKNGDPYYNKHLTLNKEDFSLTN